MIYPFDLKPGDRVMFLNVDSIKPKYRGEVGYVHSNLRHIEGIDNETKRPIKGWYYEVDFGGHFVQAKRKHLKKLPPETDAERNQIVSWDSCPWKPKELVE